MRNLLDASTFHLTECKFQNLSPATIRNYQLYELAFITYLQESGQTLALHQLNAQNVRGCAEWIQARHGEQGAKRGGQFAKKYFVSVMKTWSRFLVYEDIIEADFLAKLKRPKVTEVARVPFELHEVQAIRGAFYGNLTGTRDIAMLALMLDTGMRISEVVGLDVADLDLESVRVKVRGKGNRERLLYFGAGERGGGKTAKLLRDYVSRRRPASSRVAALFLNRNGTRITAKGWREVFVKACREAGVSSPQPHRLRHTFATRYLVRNPDDVEGLRYMLGHLDDRMYRTYAGLAGQIIAQAAGRESLVEAWFTDRPPTTGKVTPLHQRRDGEPQRRSRRLHPSYRGRFAVLA